MRRTRRHMMHTNSTKTLTKNIKTHPLISLGILTVGVGLVSGIVTMYLRNHKDH